MGASLLPSPSGNSRGSPSTIKLPELAPLWQSQLLSSAIANPGRPARTLRRRQGEECRGPTRPVPFPPCNQPKHATGLEIQGGMGWLTLFHAQRRDSVRPRLDMLAIHQAAATSTARLGLTKHSSCDIDHAAVAPSLRTVALGPRPFFNGRPAFLLHCECTPPRATGIPRKFRKRQYCGEYEDSPSISLNQKLSYKVEALKCHMSLHM
ncbi:uncharacterized protein VTP21DRAFT_9811 [Calcarisporiella thermophila]|uniref:uncharacterized protein n=1 Tax=Calcarisporiella thermophila TaxID=911321 RepID=UPI003744B1AA